MVLETPMNLRLKELDFLKDKFVNKNGGKGQEQAT